MAIPLSSSVVPVSSSSSSFDWATCVAANKCGTFEDSRESPAKTYKWVFIGTQIWMAENLAYLPSVNAKNDYSLSVAKYYVYDHDNDDLVSAKSSSNYVKYGVLYNWTAAMAGYGPSAVVQGVCPSGWHLPNSTEWGTLVTTVGGIQKAGQKLKAKNGWYPAANITNEDAYGFSAMPGGFYQSQAFDVIQSRGYWWTSTEGTNANSANFVDMMYEYNDLGSTAEQKDVGFSVRCVKNI